MMSNKTTKIIIPRTFMPEKQKKKRVGANAPPQFRTFVVGICA